MGVIPVVVGWLLVFFGNDLMRAVESSRPSVAHGTTSSGRLEYGKRLPSTGSNFRAYSRFGALLGRSSVHSTVREILVEAFNRLDAQSIDAEFVYGETGWPAGGPFPPHRTHENGTSVDIFVPVRDTDGHPVALPTWPWLKFGYSIEFDADGRWGSYQIDFETLALFLLDLQKVAAERGAPIVRVILAPEFEDELRSIPAGREALRSIPWMRGRPWVRHDEHFHIDFAVS